MFFSAITFFRFPPAVDFSQIDTLLPEAALRPVGALELASRGFVSPYSSGEPVAIESGDALLLTVGYQTKILPPSAINDLVGQKIADIEAAQGRRPGGRERKRIKDDVLHELLPRALVKSGRINAIIDTKRGFIAVDTASRKAAEAVVSDVRGLLGSFPAMPLNAEVSPRAQMTGWLAHGETAYPGYLFLGEETELRDPTEGGAVVKCQNQELCCAEIDKHLDAGKQCTKLALVLGDNLSFVLCDDLSVRKLKFLDGAVDQLADTEGEDRRTEIDARVALQVGEIGQLFDLLAQAFQITKAEG